MKIVQAAPFHLLPPKAGLCAICAVDHIPGQAHNAQSMYYGVRFNLAHGRSPTWADAVAHCSDDVRSHWERELKRAKAWTEPDGVAISEPYVRQS